METDREEPSYSRRTEIEKGEKGRKRRKERRDKAP